MPEPFDYQRLLGLDYGPLSGRVPKETVAEYRAAREGPLFQPEMGSDFWLHSYRLDSFARANGLTYTPRFDPSPYVHASFYDTYTAQKYPQWTQRFVDGLATPGGDVTVASTKDGSRTQIYTKFVAVNLGHQSRSWKLSPRRRDRNDAESELDRHFDFTGDSDNPSAMSASNQALASQLKEWYEAGYSEEQVQAALREQLRQVGRFKRWRNAVHQSKETDTAHRAQAGRMFDDDLGRLIVEHAKGCTIETYRSRMFISRSGFTEDGSIKPDVLLQMFTMAAILAPAVADMRRNRP